MLREKLTLVAAPIKRAPSLATQVYEAILDSIVSGQREPGARIVVEHVAEQLGVSPTPVREALARLLQEGLISETATGKLQVVPLTPRYVADTFFVRGALEGLAAELAAPRISAAQLALLHAALVETAAALPAGDVTVYAATDALLHRTICDVANNAVLAREIQMLQFHVDYIRGYSQRQAGEHLRLSHDEHVRLLAALSLHDGLAAREAMETHIRNASARIAQLIDFPLARTS